MNAVPQSNEHYILTFIGGDMDGRVIDSRSPAERERQVAEMFLSLTDNGAPGKSVFGHSYSSILDGSLPARLAAIVSTKEPHPPVTKAHAYRAVSHTVEDGVHHVRVEYFLFPTGKAKE